MARPEQHLSGVSEPAEVLQLLDARERLGLLCELRARLEAQLGLVAAEELRSLGLELFSVRVLGQHVCFGGLQGSLDSLGLRQTVRDRLFCLFLLQHLARFLDGLDERLLVLLRQLARAPLLGGFFDVFLIDDRFEAQYDIGFLRFDRVAVVWLCFVGERLAFFAQVQAVDRADHEIVFSFALGLEGVREERGVGVESFTRLEPPELLDSVLFGSRLRSETRLPFGRPARLGFDRS